MISISHIGSLPFLSTKEAAEFNSKFTIPCKFTLPNLNEKDLMTYQVLKKYKVFDEKLIKEKFYFNNYSLSFGQKYKSQIMGPVTASLLLGNVPLQKFKNWYLRNLIEALKNENVDDCYFFLDEPMLFKADQIHFDLLNFVLSEIKDMIFSLGVHSCERFSFEKVDQSSLDSISVESKYFEEYKFNTSLEIFLGVLETDTLKPADVIALSKNKIHLTPNCGLAFSKIDLVQSVPEKLLKWGKMALLL